MRRHRLGLIGVVIALFIVGLYFYGTIENTREGARAKRIEDLRRQIVTYANQHPEAGLLSLEQLKNGGALSGEDLDFIQERNIAYHPISAQSPDDALVFVVPRHETERHYYKGGRTAYITKWLSPDKAYAVINTPSAQSSSMRTVAVVEQASNRTLGLFDMEASPQRAFWNPRSRFVAINTASTKSTPTFSSLWRITLMEVSSSGVKTMVLPAGLEPASLLPAEEAKNGVRWNDDWVMALEWVGDQDLLVEAQGRGWLGGPNTGHAPTFNLIYRFVVRVNGDGAVSIVKKTQTHFVKSQPKSL
jgi:hypothetical protein